MTGAWKKPRSTRLRLVVHAAALMIPLLLRAHTIDFAFERPGAIAVGTGAQSQSGRAVAFADVDGDGREDLVIGAPATDFAGRTGCGAVYIVLASDELVGDTLATIIDLGEDRPDIKRIFGPESGSALGTVLATGDVNGDLSDDIICGLPGASPSGRVSAGVVWVVLGAPALEDTVDLGLFPPGTARVLGESAFDKLGSSLASGDVNGDGYEDIVAGAPLASTPAGAFAGKAYVLPGNPNFPSVIDLAAPLAGVTRLLGEHSNDTFGTAVCAADLDGDTLPDILVGAPQAPAPGGRIGAGIIYLFPAGGALPDTIYPHPGAYAGASRLVGPNAGALLGSAIAVEKFNRDDIPDLAASAPENTPDGRIKAGSVFLVQGNTTWPDTTDLGAPNDRVFRIDGPAPNLKAGLRIAVGDVNFDGLADVSIGIPLATPSAGRIQAGEVFVVFGRPIFGGNIDLAVDQSGVTRINGVEANGMLGSSVAIGVTSPDGFGDLLMGAPGASGSGGTGAGRTYLLLGESGVMPTGLLSYRAAVVSGRVEIEWALVDDLPAALMTVVRSDRNGRLTTLPHTDIVRTGVGHYRLVDAGAQPGQTYIYRVAAKGDGQHPLFVVVADVPPLSPHARLFPATPNPFRTETALDFEIPPGGPVRVSVHDVTGAAVAVIYEAAETPGRGTVRWDGRNARGEAVSSGVYFVRLMHTGGELLRKVVITR